MLTAVVVFNFLLGLGLLWLTVQALQWRRLLAGAAAGLAAAERSTHALLYQAPEAILSGQRGTAGLRVWLRSLEPKLQQASQVLLWMDRLGWLLGARRGWRKSAGGAPGRSPSSGGSR